MTVVVTTVVAQTIAARTDAFAEARQAPRRRRRFADIFLYALALLSVCALGGCAAGIDVEPADPTQAYLETIAQERFEQNRGEKKREALPLSEKTRHRLRLLNFERQANENPELVLRAVDRLQRDRRDPSLLPVVAELALAQAWKSELPAPTRAAEYFLLAADRSFQDLFRIPAGDDQLGPLSRAFDPTHRLMQEVYRRAVAGYVSALMREGGVRDHRRAVIDELLHVRIKRGSGTWSPGYFDQLFPADRLDVVGFRNRYQDPGLGAPLVAYRMNRGRGVLEPHYPPEGIIYPATAVMRFDVVDLDLPIGERPVELTLYDPWQIRSIDVSRQRIPLAADFTAPFATLISRTELKKLGHRGMREAEQIFDHQGLFMLEPYAPDKIPVLMIHGLRSSPLAWIELTNDLLGDPEIRNAYQIWHYMYPTGLPYLYSALQLRETLEELQGKIDPQGTHRAWSSMVLVAHSMGGLLSKTLIGDSSSGRLWDAVLKVPPDRAKGSPEHVRRLRKMLFFEPQPSVDRVIFISVPHRGSDLASGLIGRLSSGLIELPEDFREMTRDLALSNGEHFSSELRADYARGNQTSVRALSPGSPMIQALAAVPLSADVPYHTILGNRGKGGEEEISDGVVTWASAHLPGARSELLVPSKHDAHSHPQTIAEVRRILREHLQELRDQQEPEPETQPLTSETQPVSP